MRLPDPGVSTVRPRKKKSALRAGDAMGPWAGGGPEVRTIVPALGGCTLKLLSRSISFPLSVIVHLMHYATFVQKPDHGL
jgi:hypothetical protein